jgi:hypothetical protein
VYASLRTQEQTGSIAWSIGDDVSQKTTCFWKAANFGLLLTKEAVNESRLPKLAFTYDKKLKWFGDSTVVKRVDCRFELFR